MLKKTNFGLVTRHIFVINILRKDKPIGASPGRDVSSVTLFVLLSLAYSKKNLSNVLMDLRGNSIVTDIYTYVGTQ